MAYIKKKQKKVTFSNNIVIFFEKSKSFSRTFLTCKINTLIKNIIFIRKDYGKKF
jgi:hypothetical protein